MPDSRVWPAGGRKWLVLSRCSQCRGCGGLDRAWSQRWHSWAWCTEGQGWRCGQARPSHDGRSLVLVVPAGSSRLAQAHGSTWLLVPWCGWSCTRSVLPCPAPCPAGWGLRPWCSAGEGSLCHHMTHSSDQNHLASDPRAQTLGWVAWGSQGLHPHGAWRQQDNGVGPPRSERTEEAEVSQAGGTRDTASAAGGTTSGPAAPRSPWHGPGAPVAMAPWLPIKDKYGVGEWGLQALGPVEVPALLERHRAGRVGCSG